ncbi:hypothetical protein QJS10_CPB04g01155 [Acorus calamus]|uniref:Reverse transcriptase zinc-binding domain-containing protein n=1 Tax=Acorus calamus TaxID=4465 RepID=A0AAV9F096_ACOCL|nr:hypothetical protein QJS10_CPB04g01155 [Acorus calamus]
MESIFWNVRGLMGAEKQLEMSKFIRSHNPPFVSLLETKLDDVGLTKLEKKLDYLKSTFLSVEGRICILWNSELVHITVLESSAQHVHCHIQCKKTLRSFYSTTIYASNTYSERLLLWNTITKLSSGLQGSPWIVGGDFNEVRYSSEKVGGRPVHPRRLRKFNSCIEMSSLQDLKALGHTLSWNNRQVVRIMCRLDRVLVNSSFTNLFSHSLVNYLAPGISDHSPLKVTYEPVFPSGPKPFKYFEMWESHPTFKDIVEAAWGIEVWGSPMYKIVKKLSATKLALKQWNKECFGPVQHALQQSRVVLAEIQALLQYNPLDPELISQERSARDLYARQLSQEESFLKQKSRQMWLSSGDTNSKFFYDSLKSRSVVNSISRLRSIDGSELSSPEEIKNHIVQFYTDLLNRDSGASIPPIPTFGSITNEENLGLLSPKDIEKLLRDFLWQGISSDRKIHHVAWDTICKPLDEGGLGIKSIKDWSQGAVGMRLWEIAKNQSSLWVWWMKKRYLKRENLWNAKICNSHSSTWIAILHAREWVAPKLRYVIFEGKSINLWYDPWINGKSLMQRLGRISYDWGPPLEATVSAFLRNGKWMKPVRAPVDLEQIWEEIQQLESGGRGEDILIWYPSKTGILSLPEAWKEVRHTGTSFPWSKWLWQPIQTPKHSLCAWQASLDKLPTLSRLLSKGLIQNSECPLCSSAREDIDHLLLGCPFSRFIWSCLFRDLLIRSALPCSMVAFPSWHPRRTQILRFHLDCS